jgi:hypothetical protein
VKTLPRTTVASVVLSLFSVVTPPQSWADAPKYPDMSRYTPANVADYEIDASTPGIQATQVAFLTPDDIVCSFSNPAGAGCSGNNFPGVPPASPPGGALVNAIGTGWPLQPTNSPLPHASNLKTLPPFHTLTVNGVTCGVDDARTTACKDSQGRGFVLSPKGSGAFQ